MITKLFIRNFKRLQDTKDIELGSSVVFIGPNNSGKTTALQALALWHLGLQKWVEKKLGKTKAKERTAISLNRLDIFAIPTPRSIYLWNDLEVRKSQRNKDGKLTGTKNIKIEISAEGITEGKNWKCGLEFDYLGDEVVYCRPIQNISTDELRLASKISVAYLPPMSGLDSHEVKLLPTTVGARIGEGRTGEVLRNLCYQILYPEVANGSGPSSSGKETWNSIVLKIDSLFGVKLNEPNLNTRGEITITYLDNSENELDLSSSGRGLQQTLLLLAYLYANPRSVLLLDEPDAHLEILRQREIYSLLTETAREKGSQIIAASHSEVVFEEASDKDIVIAFIGKYPHRINDRGSQLRKSLTTIGYHHYYQAEIKKWVLYLEGSSDFSILKSFAKTLEHPALKYLESPFVHYVSTNRPKIAEDHFYGLKEAVPELKGIAIFDRIENELQNTDLKETMWQRREIENYLCYPEVLKLYAQGTAQTDLFSSAEQENRIQIMENAIQDLVPRGALKNLNDKWWIDTRVSEDFLERLFEMYFSELGLQNIMRKNQFHQLAFLVPKEKILPEVIEKLDLIYTVAQSV